MMQDLLQKDKAETAPGSLRLIAHPRLSLDKDRRDLTLPAGLTLEACLRHIWTRVEGVHARVVIDGRVIERAEWGTFLVASGSVVTARAILGDGGEGGKSALRIVAMLGLVAVSIFTAGGGLAGLAGLIGGAGAWAGMVGGSIGAALAGAAISVAGSLAINVLISPPRPRLSDLSGGDNSSPTLSLTGSSNAFAPYAPIPRVCGTHRIYPPLAGRTFTEIVGADQYLRLLFCFGYGPLELDDLRIGTTPLDQFDGVELELRYGFADDTPLTLFPNDVFEESLSIKLTPTFEQRNSQPNAKELSVDVTFPSGLGEQTKNFGFQAFPVNVWVEYRQVGDPDWIQLIEVAKAARRTTNFTGVNNDLVFEARTVGAVGNSISVVFTPRTSVTGPNVQVSVQTPDGRPGSLVRGTIITVFYRLTVTTANAVISAIQAHAQADSLITVETAPGNTGTGIIPTKPLTRADHSGTFTFQLAGGANVVPAFVAQGPTQKQLRLSRRWPVETVGEYEVQVRAVESNVPLPDSFFVLRDVYWTTLRTIQNDPPTTTQGLSFVAMRIKATGQLNGTVDQFNALATSLLPDWDGTEWVLGPTSNPASIYRDVLQGTANRRPKSDAQLDLPAIQAFHDHCRTHQFAFNAVIDFSTTVKQLRQDVLAAGRGTFHLFDMKYSVLFERAQDTPVHLITSRNASSPTWRKRFIDLPHAMRVRYVDEQSDYRQNERIVYADGYSAANATIFEDAEAGLGVTHERQVFVMKRRELAEVQLRADDYTVQMDFEHLLFTRGDRVEYQADLVLAALSSGRLLDVTLDGNGSVSACVVDEPVVMEEGVDYGMRIRTATGMQCVGRLVTVGGTQTSLAFSPSIPASSDVAIGDLYTFGLFGHESVSCIVKSIRPGADHMATVSLLDYAPAIMTAEDGPIPPYEGHVTSPQVDRFIISPPIIDRVQSDETVLVRQLDGALESRILITVTFKSGFRRPVDRLEAHFRRSDSESPWLQRGLAVDGTSEELSLTPVEDGVSYDFRLRSIDTQTGATSAWTAVQGHLVIGKTSPPPDVEIVVIEHDRLRWNYANPPVDLAGFLVRYRSGIEALWDSAAPAHDALLMTTDFTIFRGIGPMTFMVKAVDVSGNQSVTPGRVTINFGAPVPEHIAIEENHRTLGWPGTITNGSVVSNQLVAASSTPFWTVDYARFWSEVGSTLMWPAISDIWLPMTYEFFFAPPPDLLEASLKLLYQIEGVWSIQYRSDSTAPMWSEDDSVLMWGSSSNPLWSARGPYVQWPGSLQPLKHESYQIRIATDAGLHRGILDQVSVFLDLATLEESLNDVVIAPGGTRLPLTKTFRQIFSVRPDLQDDGGSAAYLKVMDKNVDLHPLVAAFDSSDVTTGALIDAVVSGI